MAHVNLKTGEIYGCKEGSLIWWHEKGHIEYNKSEKAKRNAWTMQSAFVYAIISGIAAHFFSLLKWLSLAFLIVAIAYFISEEIWCWIFAINKKYLNKTK